MYLQDKSWVDTGQICIRIQSHSNTVLYYCIYCTGLYLACGVSSRILMPVQFQFIVNSYVQLALHKFLRIRLVCALLPTSFQLALYCLKCLSGFLIATLIPFAFKTYVYPLFLMNTLTWHALLSQLLMRKLPSRYSQHKKCPHSQTCFRNMLRLLKF